MFRGGREPQVGTVIKSSELIIATFIIIVIIMTITIILVMIIIIKVIKS